MAYFMHLKFERLSLILTIVPMLVVRICLMFVVFPDSFRSFRLRYKFKETPPSRLHPRALMNTFQSKAVLIDPLDVVVSLCSTPAFGQCSMCRDSVDVVQQCVVRQELQHWSAGAAGSAGDDILLDLCGTASLARN